MATRRTAENQIVDSDRVKRNNSVPFSNIVDILPLVYNFLIQSIDSREVALSSDSNESEAPIVHSIEDAYISMILVCKQWRDILQTESVVKSTIRAILNQYFDFNLQKGSDMMRYYQQEDVHLMEELQSQSDSPSNPILKTELQNYPSKFDAEMPLFTTPNDDQYINPNKIEDINKLKELLEAYNFAYRFAVVASENGLTYIRSESRPVFPCLFYNPSPKLNATEFANHIQLDDDFIEGCIVDKWQNGEHVISEHIVQPENDDDNIGEIVNQLFDRPVTRFIYGEGDLEAELVFLLFKTGNYAAGIFTLGIENLN